MKKIKIDKEIHEAEFSWTTETKDFNGNNCYPMKQFHGPAIGDTSLFMDLSPSHADMMIMYFDKIYSSGIMEGVQRANKTANGGRKP